MFLWKCYHNSIPVKNVLAQRGIQIPPFCDLCHDKLETIGHVLRDCTTAQVFWTESNRPDEMSYTAGMEVMDWIRVNVQCNVLAKGKSYPWAQFFLFGIWQLWLTRNKRLFQSSHTSRDLFKIVEAQVYEFWFCVLDHGSSRSTSTNAVRWVKPPVSWAKLNTNGAIQGTLGLAGCGGLIRDWQGNWISGFARAVRLTPSLAAELWAVCDGLYRCCALSLEAVQVEIDASVVISLLSQTSHTNGEFSSLIDDCRSLMKNIP